MHSCYSVFRFLLALIDLTVGKYSHVIHLFILLTFCTLPVTSVTHHKKGILVYREFIYAYFPTSSPSSHYPHLFSVSLARLTI